MSFYPIPEPAPEFVLPADPVPPPPAPRRRIVMPLLAWLVILGTIAFILFWPDRTPHAAGGDQLAMMRFQVRWLVGLRDLGGPAMGGDLYLQAEALDHGPPMQRIAFVVLAGELKGPKEALHLLKELRKEWFLERSDTAGARGVAHLLEKQYSAAMEPGAAGLTPEEREQLRQNLGWLGDLALTPSGSPPAAREAVLAPAHRAVIVLIIAGIMVLGGLLIGLTLAIVLVVLALTRRLRAHSEPTGSGTGGIYAETFALWMVLFLALSYLGGKLTVDWLPQLERYRLLVTGLLMLASLSVLLWPVLRGVPWRQMRREVGLVAGPVPLAEPFLGLGCYLATLPLAVLAFVVVLVLMRLLGEMPGMPMGQAQQGPSHPLLGFVASGDWVIWLQALFLAAVVAPIVEETMFRGVLYRHLREATAGGGRFLSIVFSALVAGFVFAVIHPQGWLLVPVLTALALGFTLCREWRGTLVGGMTAHGIHNGLITLLAIGMLG